MSAEEIEKASLKKLVEDYMASSDRDAIAIQQLKNALSDVRAELAQKTSEASEYLERLKQSNKDREVLIEKVLALKGKSGHNIDTLINKANEKYDNLVSEARKLIELQSRYLNSYKMSDKKEYEKFKAEFKTKIYKS